MNKMHDPLELVAALKPAMLDDLTDQGYVRHRDGDLARAAAEGRRHSWPAGGSRRFPAGLGRPQRLLLTSGVAVTAAAAVTMVAVLAGAPSASRPQPTGSTRGAPQSARSILEAFLSTAAASARHQQGPQPHPGQFFYSLAYETGVVVGIKNGHRSAPGMCMITWYDPAGRPVYDGPVSATTARATARRCEDVTPTPPGRGQLDPHAPPHWYPAPGSLPADPVRLLARLKAEASRGAVYWSLQPPAGPSPTQDVLAFELTERLLQGPISGALRAALYEAITPIPGVRLVQHAVDVLGRSGVGISMTAPDESGQRTYESEFILDPDTYAFLGTIRNIGDIPDKTAVIASGVR